VPGITKDQLSKLESESLAPLTFKAFPDEDCSMLDIAKIIRSKNSGPFELMLDIMFDTKEAYERVKNADILTNERVMELYRLQPEDINTNIFFEPALAWKCTLKRPWEQGTVGERDTLGTQQQAPLLYVRVPAVNRANIRFPQNTKYEKKN
jgi:hypothetical protein